MAGSKFIFGMEKAEVVKRLKRLVEAVENGQFHVLELSAERNMNADDWERQSFSMVYVEDLSFAGMDNDPRAGLAPEPPCVQGA